MHRKLAYWLLVKYGPHPGKNTDAPEVNKFSKMISFNYMKVLAVWCKSRKLSLKEFWPGCL
jgi:hypothetical protein